MRKTHFLSLYILLAILPQVSFAHTISQHIEELYGKTYLPVFIIAKLLPFIGLGMLSFNQGHSRISLNNHWVLFSGIVLGILFSFIHENLSIFFIGNSFGIILLGILLLLTRNPNKEFVQLILLIAGISLGYEYGINIAHAMEFKWLFIGLLIVGLSIFMLLCQIQFFQKGVKSFIRIAMGFLLVIAGLMVVLLT